LLLGTEVITRSSSSGSGSSSISAQPASTEQQQQLLQQLAADNSAGGASTADLDSYRSGAASSPVRLSLLQDADLRSTATVANAGQIQQQQQQQQAAAAGVSSGARVTGRRLQQFGGRGLITNLGIASENTIRSASDAVDATSAGACRELVTCQLLACVFTPSKSHVSLNCNTTDCTAASPNILRCSCAAGTAGVTLDPVCPALGATVLEAGLVSVDRFQVFALPVHSLDQFGSQVSQGPGSDWTVALQQPQLVALNSSSTASGFNSGSSSSSSSDGQLVQLLSAARGRLSGGQVVLEGLSIAAPPGSELVMQLTARAPQASLQQVRKLLGSKPRTSNCVPQRGGVWLRVPL
jgi:hypothetical protein